ncbi:speckle-type POZ protein B [Nephila pilipes]|uniref:Speckle-type POZ protein B n=1 Tax=Nephila pilipes TaxID=299642 RepID=A0A8X6UEG9_NEPPI|nr:speckle-type POZ protein B [Nephila pilipes]
MLKRISMANDSNAEPPRSEVSKIHLKSFLSVRIFEIQWDVEDFSKISYAGVLLGPEIRTTNFTGCVKLRKDYDTYQLMILNKSSTEKDLECDVCVLNMEHKRLCYLASDKRNIIVNGFSQYFDIANGVLKNLPGNVLIIKCCLKIRDVQHESVYAPEMSKTPPIHYLEDISTDFKAMLVSSKLTDISLLVGSDVLHVHKFVLCARSPVFARMFESGMKETTENVIVIVDLDLPVLKSLIDFMYTGTIVDDFEAVFSLFYAADKYGVSSLQKLCREYLLSHLEISNACRLLILADRHSDPHFKDRVIGFIKFHYAELKNTIAWEDLK